MTMHCSELFEVFITHLWELLRMFKVLFFDFGELLNIFVEQLQKLFGLERDF